MCVIDTSMFYVFVKCSEICFKNDNQHIARRKMMDISDRDAGCWSESEDHHQLICL